MTALPVPPPDPPPPPERGGEFADFYREVWPALAGYCESLVRDEELGAELAQEAMVRVYVRYGLLADARPYAFRVATNLARDAWRRGESERAAVVALGERALVTDEGRDALLPVVRALPKHLRDTVLLHYWADLRIEDVARALHRPVGTVKRRLHDARRRLAEELSS